MLGAVTNVFAGAGPDSAGGGAGEHQQQLERGGLSGRRRPCDRRVVRYATVTNWVADGDASFANGGVFTIGGQNTSGINTYNNPIILGWNANNGKGVTLVAATGGEVDFAGPILANGTDTTAGVTVGDAVHAGTVKLLGANTYAGGTTVNNGNLVVSGSIGNGVTTVNGGSLTINAIGVVGNGSGAANVVTVSNATLAVNGVLDSSKVTILNGGVLAGGGTINGVNSAVTNQTGGSVAPGVGVSTAGTVLSISGKLVLTAGGTTILAVSHSHAASDQIAAGAVFYGGTLSVVTNAGDVPFQAGDTFQLFNSADDIWNGSFASINLPMLTRGWYGPTTCPSTAALRCTPQ